jgi:hypothetical protein
MARFGWAGAYGFRRVVDVSGVGGPGWQPGTGGMEAPK